MIQKFFYKYSVEIKNRILLILFGWLFYFNICYQYKKTILFMLINSNKFFFELNNYYFIFTNITDVFYVYFDLIIFFTNQIIVIIFFYQILIFFAKGLYKLEFQKLKLIFFVFIIFWVFVFFVTLKIIVPTSWNFFLNFKINSDPIVLFFEAKLDEYLKYCINLYFVCLINCEFLFLITILLTKLNKQIEKTKIFRKFFYLLFITFSTAVTPPDILSQLSLNSLLISIYEFSIFFNKIKKVNN